MGGTRNEAPTLRDYLQVVRRRKLVLLLTVVLTPAVALTLSLRQQHLYQGSAQVLLNRQDLANTLTGTQDPNLYQPADRLAETQAKLARVPTVVVRTLRAAGAGALTVDEFLADSSVTAETNADLLDFHVTNPSRALARRLATAYARQFAAYRRGLDDASLQRALDEVRTQLAKLHDAGVRHSALKTSLIQKQQELQTMMTLQTPSASVVHTPRDAKQVQPRPLRDSILALALAIVAGLGLAFLRDSLDARVRTADEISEYLETPLLGRVPEPPRKVAKKNQLVIVAQPAAPQAEALRMVRTNLEFTRREREAQTVLVTSPGMSEGKSTTTANLAVAAARGGLDVILVDLDLRRPTQERYFRLEGRPGLTDVVVGNADLDDALARIGVGGSETRRRRKRGGAANANGNRNGNGNGHVDEQSEGSLRVLPSGPLPHDAAEFLGKRAVGDVLDELRSRADLILVDTTPLLVVGDAMHLTGAVDGIMLVLRGKYVRRPMLKELGRVLAACPADTLGFVVTGEPLPGDDYGYGGYRYGPKPYTRAKKEKDAVA